ncbi:MAG TPA: hypothetical protein VGD14_16110, partial [bacterium]
MDSENQKDERYADNEYYEKYDNYDEKKSHYFIAPKICYVEDPVVKFINNYSGYQVHRSRRTYRNLKNTPMQQQIGTLNLS